MRSKTKLRYILYSLVFSSEDFESKIGSLEYSIAKHERKTLNSRIGLNLNMNQNNYEIREKERYVLQ